MFAVIAFLITGIMIGIVFRTKTAFIKRADNVTSWAIYLLLFLMGLSVGGNKVILSSLSRLGILALLLTGAAIAGSVLTSWLVYVSFFKGKNI